MNDEHYARRILNLLGYDGDDPAALTCIANIIREARKDSNGGVGLAQPDDAGCPNPLEITTWGDGRNERYICGCRSQQHGEWLVEPGAHNPGPPPGRPCPCGCSER